MTPSELEEYLKVCQRQNVMQVHLKTEAMELNATFGMPIVPEGPPVAPGGWKTDAQDPEDPDPLKLGSLDAEIVFDAVPENEPIE